EALERLRTSNPSAAGVDPSRFDNLLEALVDDGLTDKFLAVFSAAYVSRLEAGETGVAATLAAIMNRSLPTARGYIREARRRGLDHRQDTQDLAGNADHRNEDLTSHGPRLVRFPYYAGTQSTAPIQRLRRLYQHRTAIRARGLVGRRQRRNRRRHRRRRRRQR